MSRYTRKSIKHKTANTVSLSKKTLFVARRNEEENRKNVFFYAGCLFHKRILLQLKTATTVSDATYGRVMHAFSSKKIPSTTYYVPLALEGTHKIFDKEETTRNKNLRTFISPFTGFATCTALLGFLLSPLCCSPMVGGLWERFSVVKTGNRSIAACKLRVCNDVWEENVQKPRIPSRNVGRSRVHSHFSLAIL